jgi:hypothetical protein
MATLTEERISVSHPEVAGGDRRRMPVFVVLGVVFGALLGLGLGWLAFNDSGSDVPADVEQLIEDYETAWNELDAEAADALMAPGARHYALGTVGLANEGVASDDLEGLFNGGIRNGINLEIEQVYGELPYLVVSSGTAYNYRGFSVTYIDEVGGELLILDHIWLD